MLCRACSVFCTMKRLMTGYFFCTYKTIRSRLSIITCNPFKVLALKAHVDSCTGDSVHEEGKVLQPGSQSKSYDFSFFLQLTVLTPKHSDRVHYIYISAILTLSCSLIPHKPPVKQNRSDWITLDSSRLVLFCLP